MAAMVVKASAAVLAHSCSRAWFVFINGCRCIVVSQSCNGEVVYSSSGAPGGRNMVKMEARVSGCVEMKMMMWQNVIGSNSLVEIKPTWHVQVGQF
ncbi:hypothetical protein DEO72_LG7g1721 [Vigna unguiculata]|uniref:Uncharacterized protein n=1 Tax=Vigna unguiculata TaxID=3917 RepID=A0A4D6MI84_VIGUN|nr:hypothetical protein DEO72_LG7g1721 [Vigna unguiculata]